MSLLLAGAAKEAADHLFIFPSAGASFNLFGARESDGKRKKIRVTLTSSIAAVSFKGKPLYLDDTVDETWFSVLAFCEKSKELHGWSSNLVTAAMAGERDAEEAGLEWVGPPHSSHAVKFPKEGPCII
ncbi:hypothetical protein Q3G72_030682 [Acer saccharum]|nr:hypothetical protein Q3G72_030682 [Acer saccharum]